MTIIYFIPLVALKPVAAIERFQPVAVVVGAHYKPLIEKANTWGQ